jgi:hypothetical protein
MAQGFGHIALFEAHRDDENFIVREEVRFFEREFEFLVPIALLFIESIRKADNGYVTLEEGIADLILPILPGLETFRIKPNVQPVSDQTLIQLADSVPVIV